MANCDNPANGANFEMAAQAYFESQGIILKRGFPLAVGVGPLKKVHAFDLGADSPEKILVECKRYCWQKGEIAPSAKKAAFNEAMYYFSLVSDEYRKILFVLRDLHLRNQESLGSYLVRTYEHLIPSRVEILECDALNLQVTTLFPRG